MSGLFSYITTQTVVGTWWCQSDIPESSEKLTSDPWNHRFVHELNTHSSHGDVQHAMEIHFETSRAMPHTDSRGSQRTDTLPGLWLYGRWSTSAASAPWRACWWCQVWPGLRRVFRCWSVFIRLFVFWLTQLISHCFTWTQAPPLNWPPYTNTHTHLSLTLTRWPTVFSNDRCWQTLGWFFRHSPD